MSNVHTIMKYLTPYELDHIKFIAHNKEIPFHIISNPVSYTHLTLPTILRV